MQEVINTLVAECSPGFFSLGLSGSTMLTLDFIYATNTVITSPDSKVVSKPFIFQNTPLFSTHIYMYAWEDSYKGTHIPVHMLFLSISIHTVCTLPDYYTLS